MEEKKIFIGFAVVSFVLLMVAVSGIADRRSDETAQATAPEESEVSASEVEGVTETELVAETASEQEAAAEESVETLAPEIAEVQEVTAEAETRVKARSEDTIAVEVAEDTMRLAGETALFADGALRVFVSRIDADAGEARLTVNGNTVTLSTGATTTVSAGGLECSVIMNAVSTEGAGLSAVCGDDLAEPNGIAVGETETLMDGKLRVFASKIDEESARLAINGELTTLDVGAVARADLADERCRVTLSSVDRAHAEVLVNCGAMPPRSAPVGPGKTILLTSGKNAARVFVSAVYNRRNQARFAVNGFGLTTSEKGASIGLDNGCEVVVEDVSGRQASFSLDCTE